MSKTRLDILLHERGYTDSRERAKAIIMSGSVYVAGKRELKPGVQVDENAELEVRGDTSRYVSRGGLKLEKALTFFAVSPDGKICVDCGASTGGFTDCLLQNGAKRVYAIDVGYGQLAWSIRSDERVVTLERTNIRHMKPEQLPERPEFAVIDVSFISLALVLPVIKELLTEDGEVICLIKPQFEAGREKVGKKGVVRDIATHIEVLDKFIVSAESAGFFVCGVTYSPVRGPEGNIEYLGYLRKTGVSAAVDTKAVAEESHGEFE